MLLPTNYFNGAPIFKALSSPVRLRIYTMIARNNGITAGGIAKALSIPPSTLAPHLQILESCGLIHTDETPASHGTQKACYVKQTIDQILIDFTSGSAPLSGVYTAEIPVGCYSDFQITAPCALSTEVHFLGLLDEPRYFAHQNHDKAEILWFNTGYVEYILPNFIPRHSKITGLRISFEISSEAPRNNDYWPSDQTFYLNGVCLGTWTSPGDYGAHRGSNNPDWWYEFLNQYGMLKTILISSSGTYMDQEKISDVTIDSLALTDQSILKFRFEVAEDAVHPGGCTLFGRKFGDYPQAIREEIRYISVSGNPLTE